VTNSLDAFIIFSAKKKEFVDSDSSDMSFSLLFLNVIFFFILKFPTFAN